MTSGGCATRSDCTSRSSSAVASGGRRAHLSGAVPRSSWRRHPGQHDLWPLGRPASRRDVETFGRVGGTEAAAIIERIRTYRRGGYAADAEDLQAEFTRICYPVYSATPGWAGESRQFLARIIRNPDVAAHYNSHEVSSFDPWSLLGVDRCPILVLAGEDDPFCPLPVVEDLASQLPADTTCLVRLPGARHTIFRDRRTSPFPPPRISSPRSVKASPPAEPRRPATKTGPQPARSRKLCGLSHGWPRLSCP
jgi:pimeloyl-ACP methyl ester carboxylesterase